jgi:predicted DNA-binding protein YlxM (UPF0122 family)
MQIPENREHRHYLDDAELDATILAYKTSPDARKKSSAWRAIYDSFADYIHVFRKWFTDMDDDDFDGYGRLAMAEILARFNPKKNKGRTRAVIFMNIRFKMTSLYNKTNKYRLGTEIKTRADGTRRFASLLKYKPRSISMDANMFPDGNSDKPRTLHDILGSERYAPDKDLALNIFFERNPLGMDKTTLHIADGLLRKGLDMNTIAKKMHCSIETVRSTVRIAAAMIAEYMEISVFQSKAADNYRETKRRLESGENKLSKRRFDILKTRLIYGFSCEDTAQKFGVSKQYISQVCRKFTKIQNQLSL